MTWVRIDDDFMAHPKIIALTNLELRVWIRVLCFCGKNEDPSVDAVTRKAVIGLVPKVLKRFAELGLLDPVDEPNLVYEVHGWEEYQPKDKTSAERKERWRSRHGQTWHERRSVSQSAFQTRSPVPVPEKQNLRTSAAPETREDENGANPWQTRINKELDPLP